MLKPNSVVCNKLFPWKRNKLSPEGDLQALFELESRLFVEFQHPVRWRRAQGHCLAANADWLPDFDVVGLHATRGDDAYEAYVVAIGILRDSTNIVLSLVCVHARMFERVACICVVVCASKYSNDCRQCPLDQIES